jgi:hypothetical protein
MVGLISMIDPESAIENPELIEQAAIILALKYGDHHDGIDPYFQYT